MQSIAAIEALEILDSRGNPTLQVVVTTDGGFTGKAAVPSGASTGEHEACELRDGDLKRYHGKGVLQALSYVEGPLSELLVGHDISDQKGIDEKMIRADGTPSKSKYGANGILGISLAVARAAAATRKQPLYRYIQELNRAFDPNPKPLSLPIPMINILNGGAHADNLLDFQEFMIRPIGAPSFKEGLRWSAEVFHTLKGLLKEKKYTTTVGDEGGYAPQLSSNEEALDFVLRAIEIAGYRPSTDFSIALDPAASEFYDVKTQRYVEKKSQACGEKYAARTMSEQVSYLAELCRRYPIDSIEDGLDQNDWEGWVRFTAHMKGTLQVVGDDLFATHLKLLKKGIEMHAANAILIKVNQVGTLTETLQTIALAHANGYRAIISHRSGETEDTTIADLAVGTGAGQIKTGSLCRSERVAKYNRLLEIEKTLENS